MPTYVAQCGVCGSKEDFVRTVAKRDETPAHCDQAMTRLGAWAIAPQVSAMNWTGHAGFAHGNLWIESGQDYKKFMAANNYIPASEASREADIQSSEKAKADDKRLESAVTTAVLGLN